MSKRIFVAVDISEPARRKIAERIDALHSEFSDLRVNWEKPEKLHLTLKFLGEINEIQLNELKKSVEKISADAFSFHLKIQDTGVFPSTKKARILWVDIIDEKKSLAKINARLETDCEKIGVAKEARKFVPHLTIARIKDPQNAKDLVAKHLQTNFGALEFKVSEIVIYESELQKQGSVYKIFSKHRLKQEKV